MTVSGKTLVMIFIFIYPLSVYGETDSNKISSFENISLIIALFSGGFIGAAALTAIIRLRYERKKIQMESLMEIFKILNDDNHRNARRKVYQFFKENDQNKDCLINNTYNNVKNQIAMVQADMDQVGTLLHHDLIPKKVLLEAYWYTILICWKSLEENIKKERNDRQYPTYMKYFEELMNTSYWYWKDNHPEVKEIIIY